MAENELVLSEQLTDEYVLALFTGNEMDPLLSKITAVVDRHVPDVSTEKGRREIASLARRVASSKVILDDKGKDLVADWKEKAKKVDAIRKRMRDELDALRDRARLPLTRYEDAEVERLKQEALDRELEQAWAEAHAERDLRERERIVREKEAELARQETERKAAEEAARREQERKEREERIAREASERAKREAEAAIQREKERAERAERETVEAETRAKREQEEAVRRAEQRAREEAERKEQQRQAAVKAEQERQQKLAANKRHRLKIEGEAIDSAMDAGLGDPEAWIVAISAGKIKHVTINY